MSTYTSEPGTRLGGRYRLEDRVASTVGWAAWKAIDETLARPVTVITFVPGFPRIAEAVTSARAVSRISDPRIAQVFDVDDDWDGAYVVTEWCAGDTLDDLLAPGPMEPAAGGRIIGDAATAIASAHGNGLAHLCLSPRSIRWTATSGTKVLGLGLDAALCGAFSDDPQAADTLALGRLLYATLTGAWPGADSDGLPPAPVTNGVPCTPRQVRAGVPGALDDITRRALGLGSALEISTPGQLARELRAAVPPDPVPPADAYGARQRPPPRPAPRIGGRGRPARSGTLTPGRYRTGDGQPGGHTEPPGTPHGYQDWDARPDYDGSVGSDPSWVLGAQPPRDDDYPRPTTGHAAPRGGRLRAAVAAALALVAVLAVAAATKPLWHRASSPGTTPGHTHSSSPTAPARHDRGTTTQVLTPVRARGFDALRTAQQDPGDENTAQAANVLNGNAAGWDTQWYDSPYFAHLKAGTGLILDMGTRVRISSITVKFGRTSGANVKILVGDSAARSAANLNSMRVLAQRSDIPGGTVQFAVSHAPLDRYIVIWFTKLPPDPSAAGKYMAQIFRVTIRGTS